MSERYPNTGDVARVTRPLRARAFAVALIGVLALVAPLVLSRSAGAGIEAGEILIYGPSLGDPEPFNEQTEAVELGFTVTVDDEETWAARSTASFASFDAIVIGDAGCDADEAYLDTATANRSTWAAAVTGNAVVHNFDPVAHNDEDEAEADDLIANAISFAAGESGTGLSLTLGCAFGSDDEGSDLPLLDPFGSFTIESDNDDDALIVVPGHPTVSGLTSAGLSNWGESYHSSFVTWPPEFTKIVEDDSSDAGVILARDVAADPTSVQGDAYRDQNGNGIGDPGDIHLVGMYPNAAAVDFLYRDGRANPPGPPIRPFECDLAVTVLTPLAPNKVQLDGNVVACRGLGQVATFTMIVTDSGLSTGRDKIEITLFRSTGAIRYQATPTTTAGLGDLVVE